MTDDTAHISNKDWQDAFIERIDVQTPTVKSFVLRPRAPQPFLAGQHVDVRLTAPDGYEAHRSYSIASSPTLDGVIELAIEELRDGEVSPYFHDIARVGDVVEVRGPFTTHFAWRPEEHGRVLLVGGGSGVAPLMSMLRQRAELNDAPPMTLVYSARSWSDVIFRDELLRHERDQAGFRLFFVITRDAASPPLTRAADFVKRLDAAAMGQVLASTNEAPDTCFVCGNNSFVGAAASAMIQVGVSSNIIRTERYGG